MVGLPWVGHPEGMWGPRITLSLSLLTGCYSGVGTFDAQDGVEGEGASAGEGEGEDEGETSDPGPDGWASAATPMRRLTGAQYLQSTRDLLDLPAWEPVSKLPDEGANEEQFVLPNVLAANVSTNATDFGRYRAFAREAAETAFATDDDLAARLGCLPTAPDEACVVEYLATACERAFGRVVHDDDEVLASLVSLVKTGRDELGSVRAGVQWAVTAVLQSPEFIYVYPVGDGDGGMEPLSRARQLSLMFLDSVPDQDLLDRARDGSLADPAVVEAEVDRLVDALVADPSKRGAVQRFFDDWWGMGVVGSIGKDPTAFPEFDEELRTAMRDEFVRWLGDIVFERRASFRSVLLSDRMFVNDQLAELYGLPGEFGTELVGIDRPADGPRSGLLSSAAFLAVNAHPSLTSPSARGRFVVERLLCDVIGSVPNDVDPTIPPPEGPETTRERFEERHTEEACAGCHDRMDPPGFALEEYDALGRYRREETVVFGDETFVLPVDTTGTIGEASFDDSKQMAALIADDPRFTRCVTRQLLRQVLGREVAVSELPVLEQLEQQFIAEDLDFIELMRRVAKHRVFTSFTEAE